MSTLWTPYGEKPVGSPEPGRQDRPSADAAHPNRERSEGGREHGTEATAGPGEAEDMRRALEAVLATPMPQVVAELAVQLRELALVHLSALRAGRGGSLDAARLAIDAMGTLVEGLGERLAPHDGPLRAALADARLAFVQIGGAPHSAGTPGAPA
jgi:hypothetical protein